MAGGARRSTRRSRLRGRSTRARTTEPRYSTMKPITATSHRCGPGPVEASDDVDGVGAGVVAGVVAAVVGAGVVAAVVGGGVVAPPAVPEAITGAAGDPAGAVLTMPVAAVLFG